MSTETRRGVGRAGESLTQECEQRGGRRRGTHTYVVLAHVLFVLAELRMS